MEKEEYMKKMDEINSKVIELLTKMNDNMELVRSDISLLANLVRHNIGIPIRQVGIPKMQRRSEVI